MRLLAVTILAAAAGVTLAFPGARASAAALAVSRQLDPAAPLEQRPRPMALSRDASTLAVIEADGTVRLWDARKGRMVRELPGSQYGTASPSPDGRFLAQSSPTGVQGQNMLWDIATGEQLWKQPSPGTSWFHFTADGKHLTIVTSVPTRRSRTSIQVVETQSGKFTPLRASMWDHPTYALSPDGGLLAVRSRDAGEGSQAVLIHDVRSGELRARLEGMPNVVRMALDPDGKRLAVADATGALTLWNVAEGKPERILAERPMMGLPSPLDLTFSPTGRMLVGYRPLDRRNPDPRPVRRWNGETGAPLPALPQSEGLGEPVFTPDETRLAARSPEGTLRLWNPRTGELIRSFEAPEIPAPHGRAEEVWHRFTPDARSLVAVGEQELRRWDIRSGRLEHSFGIEPRPVAADPAPKPE